MPAHYRHHLRLSNPDFKLSIFENYLDCVLIGSLQVPEGKSLAAIYANWVPEAQILTVGLWSSVLLCEFGKQRGTQLGLPPGQSHRPVLAKPTCGPDKSDTLARLRRHAGGVREGFTTDKGDVRVSSGADKGDVRVGSSADKGDVQMSRIKRDGVPVGGAKRGVGWARDGRGMGARRAAARRLQCERTGASIDLTRHMGATRSQRHCAVVSPSRDGICGRVAARESIMFIYPT
ncbi:hypothetical protein K438DRAFT_1942868 [Mycena galopus ATCC 62051]|nr:hypothetical protein K438DRAFT_1942868 [Mycena galopus ATCC 62051]